MGSVTCVTAEAIESGPKVRPTGGGRPPYDFSRHRRAGLAAPALTSDPRPNGRPPRHAAYRELVERGFEGWRFEVGGLVEHPLSLTLDELRALAPQQQITQHKCVQGWSYVAEWQGLPLTALLERCRPTPEARYMLFRSFDDKWDRVSHPP